MSSEDTKTLKHAPDDKLHVLRTAKRKATAVADDVNIQIIGYAVDQCCVLFQYLVRMVLKRNAIYTLTMSIHPIAHIVCKLGLVTHKIVSWQNQWAVISSFNKDISLSSFKPTVDTMLGTTVGSIWEYIQRFETIVASTSFTILMETLKRERVSANYNTA